jgi:hypothetical protein
LGIPPRQNRDATIGAVENVLFVLFHLSTR